jgi:lipoate-protein ligase A
MQGTIDFRLKIKQGLISYLKIYGDFLGQADVGQFATKLIGIRYDRQAIVQALADVDLVPYFGKIDRQAIIDLLVRQE